MTFSSKFVTSLSRSESSTFISTISSTSFLPFFLMIKAPVSLLKAASPAQSPSFIFERSMRIAPLHWGPSMRWVSVLGARYSVFTTRFVFRRRNPGRSFRLHASSMGLWFHCQCSPSLASEKSSLFTMAVSGSPLTNGRTSSGTLPSSSPNIGQPLIQRQGITVSTRPTPPRSWKMIPYQSPSCVSTIVPCAS